MSPMPNSITQAQGIFSNCGPGIDRYELHYNCKGPACTSISGFQNVKCNTDGGAMTCSNDFKCPDGISSYQSNFTFGQNEADPWSPTSQNERDSLVPQQQRITIPSCAKFSLTSDGTKEGTGVDDEGRAGEKTCPKVQETPTPTAGSGLAKNASPKERPQAGVTSRPQMEQINNGPRRSTSKTVLFATFLFGLILLLPGTHASSDFRRRAELRVRDVSDKVKAFAQILSEDLAIKANAQGQNGEVFAHNLVADVVSSVCDEYFSGTRPSDFAPVVIQRCIKSIYGGEGLAQPAGQFSAVFGASLLCDYVVSEAYPVAQEFFPDGCEGLQELARKVSPTRSAVVSNALTPIASQTTHLSVGNLPEAQSPESNPSPAASNAPVSNTVTPIASQTNQLSVGNLPVAQSSDSNRSPAASNAPVSNTFTPTAIVQASSPQSNVLATQSLFNPPSRPNSAEENMSANRPSIGAQNPVNAPLPGGQSTDPIPSGSAAAINPSALASENALLRIPTRFEDPQANPPPSPSVEASPFPSVEAPWSHEATSRFREPSTTKLRPPVDSLPAPQPSEDRPTRSISLAKNSSRSPAISADSLSLPTLSREASPPITPPRVTSVGISVPDPPSMTPPVQSPLSSSRPNSPNTLLSSSVSPPDWLPESHTSSGLTPSPHNFTIDSTTAMTNSLVISFIQTSTSPIVIASSSTPNSPPTRPSTPSPNTAIVSKIPPSNGPVSTPATPSPGTPHPPTNNTNPVTSTPTPFRNISRPPSNITKAIASTLIPSPSIFRPLSSNMTAITATPTASCRPFSNDSDYCPGLGCVNFNTDRVHCGGCNKQCDGYCDEGSCICNNGERASKNNSFCKGRNETCEYPTKDFCQGFGCIDFSTNNTHCGGCMDSCKEGLECYKGACLCPGALHGQPDNEWKCNATDPKPCADDQTLDPKHKKCCPNGLIWDPTTNGCTLQFITISGPAATTSIYAYTSPSSKLSVSLSINSSSSNPPAPSSTHSAFPPLSSIIVSGLTNSLSLRATSTLPPLQFNSSSSPSPTLPPSSIDLPTPPSPLTHTTCPLSLPDTCSGACVDKNTNKLNCGSCGNQCSEGWSCANGGCWTVWAPGVQPDHTTTKNVLSLATNLAEPFKPLPSVRPSPSLSETPTTVPHGAGGFIAKGFDGLW